jgi:cytochrome c-type biogenesis protein CcmH
MLRIVVLAGILLLLITAFASPSTIGLAYAEDPLTAEGRDIARALVCPVCENLSVLDSPSPLAQQMRTIINEKLTAGESREQILAYFVDRYGEGVLLEPPKRGFSLLVWLGPIVAALAGAAVVGTSLRRWLKRRSESSAAEYDSNNQVSDERLEAELRKLT